MHIVPRCFPDVELFVRVYQIPSDRYGSEVGCDIKVGDRPPISLIREQDAGLTIFLELASHVLLKAEDQTTETITQPPNSEVTK